MKSIISLACDIACHAGWYCHYSKRDSLSLGMCKWSHESTKRGMKWIQWMRPFSIIDADIYIIDGSTARRARRVLLARIDFKKWILIVELDKFYREEYWVKGKYNFNHDYVRYDMEITEDQALKILASYWRCALINKDIYPHLDVLLKALRQLEVKR